MPPSWGAGGLLHPARRTLSVERPAEAREVTITGAGPPLRGWFFRNPAGSRGTLVYLHGSADNRTSGLSIARRFLARGFDVLAYDSRAHGASEGDACTYGYFEKEDLTRALDAVEARRVVLFGVSLGAAVALQAAPVEPRIAGLVAVATFADLRSVAMERAPFFASAAQIEEAFRLAERRARFEVDAVSPVRAAADIRVPVLLVHGAADRETSAQHSRRVFEALPGGRKRLLLVPGAGHNDALRPEVWTAVDEWLDAALGP